MSCRVYLYDATMTALTSTFIELLKTDYWGAKIDLQRNGPLGAGAYGADLAAPSPTTPPDNTRRRRSDTSTVP